MGEASWGGLGMIVGAFITGFFTWLVQRNSRAAAIEVERDRGTAAIEVAVLAEWQKLNAALAKRVSALEAELAEVRRNYANEIDEMRRNHRAEIRALRDLNEGLQRQIAQNSQSTAQMLSTHPETRPKDDGHEK